MKATTARTTATVTTLTTTQPKTDKQNIADGADANHICAVGIFYILACSLSDLSLHCLYITLIYIRVKIVQAKEIL
jgi:hypothetical protein